LQNQYQTILAASGYVIIASVIAFTLSQMLDIMLYQRIKELSHGKWLWLRSNISMYFGQMLDSCILVLIVFHASSHKLDILMGSIVIKLVFSFLMTPIIYLIVGSVDRYLGFNTFAFKNEAECANLAP
jgi:hypothetical protein